MQQEEKTVPAVAIINYNTCEHLRACLNSILPESPSEMIVVDNASTDGSAEMVQAEFPQVSLYANKTNCGYGAAANQAITSCTAKYVLLLNSDTRLQAGALQALSIYLDQHPRAAIVGPRLENPDGSLQASCFPFPTVLNTFLWEDTFGWMIHYVPILRDNYFRTWPHTQPQVVPWVLGAALAIRREPFEAVDGFDESFFMYSEEVDLCYRLYAAGWEVHFSPTATVMHLGGASTKQHQADMALQRFASHMQFGQRHYSKIHFAALVVVMKSIALARLIGDSTSLSITQEVYKRRKIAEDIAVWRRLLFSQW
jgi:GT2 family glycosyltransferase